MVKTTLIRGRGGDYQIHNVSFFMVKVATHLKSVSTVLTTIVVICRRSQDSSSRMTKDARLLRFYLSKHLAKKFDFCGLQKSLEHPMHLGLKHRGPTLLMNTSLFWKSDLLISPLLTVDGLNIKTVN